MEPPGKGADNDSNNNDENRELTILCHPLTQPFDPRGLLAQTELICQSSLRSAGEERNLDFSLHPNGQKNPFCGTAIPQGELQDAFLSCYIILI